MSALASTREARGRTAAQSPIGMDGLPDRNAIDWQAVLRAFFRIMDVWGVRTRDQAVLLAASGSWLSNARAGKPVSLTRDQQDRVSYVLGIYRALELLLPNPDAQERWMTTANEAFGGGTPLQRALGGSLVDLASIRTYLDGVRGW